MKSGTTEKGNNPAQRSGRPKVVTVREGQNSDAQ